MKKIFVLLVTVILLLSTVAVAAASQEETAFSSSPEEFAAIEPTGTGEGTYNGVMQIYKFTFEDENAMSIMKKLGVYVGDVVEWPEGSGNHCLRYELDAETHTGAGVHPYIWPVGIDNVLAAQGDLEDTNSTLQLNVDFAYAGSTKKSPYMYPFILFNDEEENYADHSTYAPGSNEFNTGTFIWSKYDIDAPVNGLRNGGICFIDENTLADGGYMYVDNIELFWDGEWKNVRNMSVSYSNGMPAEGGIMPIAKTTTTTMTTTTTTTQIYKFTFENENATSILKTSNGDYVGEIVEWPEGSGNHCLRYELNEETHISGGGVHPYIWPEGIDDILVKQGDLEKANSELKLNIDFAYAGSTKGSYMYPFILFNDEEENYADHSTYAPGSNEFNTGTFIWSAYEGYEGVPVNGLGDGAIGFVDEHTLADGGYMYVDNIELIWNGEWKDVGEVFLGYPNRTLCEESDLDLSVSATTTAKSQKPTATEPTATEPSATATEPVIEPTTTGTETPIAFLGDANNDGAVNMKDVLALRKQLAGMNPEINLINADCNGDGDVNMKDVLMLRKFLAGIVETLGA